MIVATKCLSCNTYLRDCNCNNPFPVCSNCNKLLGKCDCAVTPERCMVCGKWNAYEYYRGGTSPSGKFYLGGFVCDKCLMVLYKTPDTTTQLELLPIGAGK